MEFKVFVLLITLLPVAVLCFSAGAPDGECSTMTPRHHVDPQTSPFPYNILISKKQIKAGETIEVTIKGKSSQDTIKGLLVQARVGDTPIGTFDTSPSSQYIQLLNCGNSKSSAVTHKKIENEVSSVKMLWTAPRQITEKVIFYTTVAKNGGTFWVAQKSDIVTVR